jgi:hypothetical protein
MRLSHRHCEEQSDEAIQFLAVFLDCFVALLLAMTAERCGFRRKK